MSFNKWEHIYFKGEFPSREKLLNGLTLEQLNTVPSGISHSIYEEFWHLVEWQDVAISNDKEKELKFESGQRFPEQKLNDLKHWELLVKRFNDQVKKIIDYTSKPDNLETEYESGFTVADGLECLAVHNAFHFGKILAIRQVIGAWPPKENK